jgi:hypothetical protein
MRGERAVAGPTGLFAIPAVLYLTECVSTAVSTQ